MPLTLRYYLADSTHVDADTTVLAYKYPYQSTEVVVPFSALQSVLRTHHLQDVDRLGERIFFHPTGTDGLFAYDVNTQIVTSLLRYPSGDNIAADSIFVFFDYPGQIYRFNLISNAIDCTFPGSGNVYDLVRGMDVYNGYLYIDGDLSMLRKYTLDGTLVDSLNYHSLLYMTIHDSIIYSVDQYPWPNQLRRYDMRTSSFLTNLVSPAPLSEGIKIYEGKLYYCDFEKRFIGAVPIADLRTVQ